MLHPDATTHVLQQAGHERVLIGEMAVRRRLGHPRTPRDGGERDLFHRALDEERLARLQQREPGLRGALVAHGALVTPIHAVQYWAYRSKVKMYLP